MSGNRPTTDPIRAPARRARLIAITACWCALLAILQPSPAGAADAPPPAVGASAWTIERLLAKFAQVHESTVSYRESRTSALLKTPLVQTGELVYRFPDTLERRVKTPSEQIYRISGDAMTMIDRDGKPGYRVPLSSQPALQGFVESLRATLRGDLSALQKYYRVELRGEESNWLLTLLPSQAELGKTMQVVRISGAVGRMLGMEIVETSGDHVTLEFGEPQVR